MILLFPASASSRQKTQFQYFQISKIKVKSPGNHQSEDFQLSLSAFINIAFLHVIASFSYGRSFPIMEDLIQVRFNSSPHRRIFQNAAKLFLNRFFLSPFFDIISRIVSYSLACVNE